VANIEYKDHLISVSVIYNTPNKFNFTPVVEIRCADSIQVVNTILTHKNFTTQEEATRFGFELGQAWVDKRLAEPSR
jgi:hypothetical protein